MSANHIKNVVNQEIKLTASLEFCFSRTQVTRLTTQSRFKDFSLNFEQGIVVNRIEKIKYFYSNHDESGLELRHSDSTVFKTK